MTVRVGHIEFLNCFPLYHGFEHNGVLAAGREVDLPERPGVELVPGVPTDLNRMLLAGDIDLGPISSIAYARNHRSLVLSRHLSISSQGAVDSIQLVTRRPLSALQSVALSRQSATSVALLKTLLRLRYQRSVTYGDLDGSPEEALHSYDAVLLIGDQGLEALHFPYPGTACYDLGALWEEWTELPMVYAVWATREQFAREHGSELLAVEKELVRCLDYGREHLPEVVESALARTRLSRAALGRYFGVLRYDFGEEYRAGLLRFYELAFEAGELAEIPVLRFLDEHAAGSDGAAGSDNAAGSDGASREERWAV